MSKKIDLTNNIYGRLTVIKQVEDYVSPKGRKEAKWLCKCECGNSKEINGNSIKKRKTQSCGCIQKEKSSTHKKSHIKEFQTWKGMLKRCLNPKCHNYNNYGGRGITICSQWINSFETFLADVGYAPSTKHSLDRIDNNKNYEPSNCRWATRTVQNINQRIKSNNTSGHKGVSQIKKSKKWRAAIRVNGKYKFLGNFSDINDAIAARLKAEEIHHKPLLNEIT